MPEQPNPSFQGEVRTTVTESTPWWPPQTHAPLGAPNILVVLFDDVGFSDFGCYGSPINTPTINRLAGQGLRYTGFHTTAMCSTTRAALLTGAITTPSVSAASRTSTAASRAIAARSQRRLERSPRC